MFYRLINTIILLGNGGNPAQKAIQVTQLIVYPAFVLMSLIALHMCVELHMKIMGRFENENSRHLESISRIVIDSLVYTGCVTIWGHSFSRVKEHTLKIFNYLLNISEYQNNFPIALTEILTILTIFSLYFDIQFYVAASTCLLITNMIHLRFVKPILPDESISEDNIKLLYNKIKNKKLVHVFKKYWKRIVKNSSDKGIPVKGVKISVNPVGNKNLLKIINISGEESILSNKEILINSTNISSDDDWTEVETESLENSVVVCEETQEELSEYYLCSIDNQYVLVKNC